MTNRTYAPQRRKRIWARDFGAVNVTATEIAQYVRPLSDLRNTPGVGLLGATVGAIKLSWSAAVTIGATDRKVIAAARIASEDDLTEIDPMIGAGVDDDWMLWDPGFLSTPAVDGDMIHQGDDAVEGRAMRKMEEAGQDLVLGFGLVSPVGAIDVDFAVSVLVLLP